MRTGAASMKRKKGALKTKRTSSAAVANDKLATFLKQHIGTVTDMYLLNLAELTCYKERHYQQQLLLAQTNEAKLIDALKEAEQKNTELVKAIDRQIEGLEKIERQLQSSTRQK